MPPVEHPAYSSSILQIQKIRLKNKKIKKSERPRDSGVEQSRAWCPNLCGIFPASLPPGLR